ncbi:hypothetical protein [Ruminococcus sp.]|uniref:hypothetical protein n=1 Tax=Ruminococcus sp. TaxID=41978 RepID=UPI0025D18524|nr:hypothetical protein [Ruminococcus sp.]MBQ8966759.1 hypothetical protein [Ruminococcus sp.]
MNVLTRESAQAAARMLAMELRKCKGSMAGSSAKYAAMASVLVAAGIEVKKIREGNKPIAVIVDGERVEV